jgi:hypothetical protein
MPKRLSWDQALAWRMARHHLLTRAQPAGLVQVAADICGLHAQVMSSAELSLWARVEELPRDAVRDALWKHRTLVKLWAARGTLYLLPAAELGVWLSALGTQTKFGNTGHPDIDELAGAVGRALDGRVLSRDELADEVARITRSRALAENVRFSWGSYLKAASFRGLICFAESDGARVRFTSVRSWVPGAIDRSEPDVALHAVTRRFLGGYAPVTAEQVAGWWVGPPIRRRGLRMLEALGDEALEMTVEGQPSWVLAQDVARMTSVAVPDVARLLPAFDPWVISAPRALLAPERRARVYRPQGWISPVLLVNGRVAGVWRHTRTGRRLDVELDPFERLPAWARRQLEAEAERLATFLTGDLSLTWTR